jgi:hypothetical protein
MPKRALQRVCSEPYQDAPPCPPTSRKGPGPTGRSSKRCLTPAPEEPETSHSSRHMCTLPPALEEPGPESQMVENAGSSRNLSLDWSSVGTAALAQIHDARKPPSAQRPRATRKHYDNESRAAKAKYGKKGKTNASNGASEDRIQQLVRSPSCLCNKACWSQFTAKIRPLVHFMKSFWGISKPMQDAIFMTGLGVAPDCGSTSTSYELLGRPMNQKCMAKLLGLGQGHFYKALNGIPDLRFGTKEHRKYTEKVAHVDQYFAALYMSVGQSLPIQFIVCNTFVG